MPAPDDKQQYLTIRIDDVLRTKLAKVARENDRSLGAEVRVAIRAHVTGLDTRSTTASPLG